MIKKDSENFQFSLARSDPLFLSNWFRGNYLSILSCEISLRDPAVGRKGINVSFNSLLRDQAKVEKCEVCGSDSLLSILSCEIRTKIMLSGLRTTSRNFQFSLARSVLIKVKTFIHTEKIFQFSLARSVGINGITTAEGSNTFNSLLRDQL